MVEVETTRTFLKMSQTDTENFVTVVSVGIEEQKQILAKNETHSNKETNSSGYVTVLTIGDSDNNNSVSKDVIEEVLVYRLPGERLGFGLKFEGGTKASEFVKRLFIQSCAPDSPASRVTSSWGNLTEGDEVLEIDCMPVNSMTRIDCVRCLKDSNVVIKLLVRHFNEVENNKQSEQKTRSIEDLPLVISAEKKRPPPPPPPVPPRKIPRKLFKHNSLNGVKDLQEHHQENPVPSSRQISANEAKKKFQSPRSSGRSSYSPDVPRRDRRFSDGSLGPPDAEVYVDLFSQESTQSLSESDDTGSTISTVVDRFGSFPTTTTSSFAGSLPSTPTAVQKQLNLANLLNAYEDEEIVTVVNKSLSYYSVANKPEENEKTGNGSDEGGPLQPPSCFQDAPLSYGNEDMRILSDEVDASEIISNKKRTDAAVKVNLEEENKVFKKPPVPPRSRDSVNNLANVQIMKEIKSVHDENMNISNLPRLVDFVPKSVRENNDNPIEVIQLFLENERREMNYTEYNNNCDDTENMDMYNNGLDLYSSKWSLSPQLATIGEVEEEGQEFQFNRSTSKSTTPIVIVENADGDNEKSVPQQKEKSTKDNKDIDGNMEIPPSDFRQPPDGHEFPDFVETNSELPLNKQNDYQVTYGIRESPTKIYKSVECINLSQTQTHSSLNEFSSNNPSNLHKSTSMSNSDLRSNTYDSTDDIKFRNSLSSAEPVSNLQHSRSQSLIDMSALSKQKNDKWNLMVEQRKKGLSKLKGLVIPENISENEPTPTVNIPEIKSQNTSNFAPVSKLDSSFNQPHLTSSNDSSKISLMSPPWSSNTSNTIPKYSPAFKRKSLQVYPPPILNNTETNKTSFSITKQPAEDLRLENLSTDPPKSLESITSPTRSDCSFDYVSSSKKYSRQDTKALKESHNYSNKLLKDLAKSEDESDNDSALSSSQSSYISRCSPPPSPTNEYDSMNSKSEDGDKFNSQCRLLKPSSVEAINRKNILASAKCRSGRDLKVGSPVIQRKYEENENNVKEPVVKPDLSVVEKVNVAFSQVDTIAKEIIVTTAAEKPVVVKEPPVIVTNGTTTISRNPSPPLVVEKEIPKVEPVVLPQLISPKKSSTLPNRYSLKETTKLNKTTVREITRSEYLRSNRDAKPLSVNALKKNFENFGTEPPLLPQQISPVVKPRVTTRNVKQEVLKTENKLSKDKPVAPPAPVTYAKKVEEVKVKAKVKEAISVVKTAENKTVEPKTVVLNLGAVGGSLGITLAGGTDYESKDITVHRIRYGSVAYQDGRLKRGDKILSVNEKSTKGLTHAESVELLKEPVIKFLIVIEESKEEVPSNTTTTRRRSSLLSNNSEPKSPVVQVPSKTATNVISLIKDSGGLGFSIEGGKDSPQGDVPLLIKKVFQGGAADKCGQLFVGDELLSINAVSFSNLSRIEAWTLMKKIPDGHVKIHIYR